MLAPKGKGTADKPPHGHYSTNQAPGNPQVGGEITFVLESLLTPWLFLTLLASTEALTFGQRQWIRALRNPWHACASGQAGSLCEDDSDPRPWSQTINRAQDRTL